MRKESRPGRQPNSQPPAAAAEGKGSIAGKLLWKPPLERAAASNLMAFIGFLEKSSGKKFSGYDDLYRWSVEDLEGFWKAVWDFCEVAHSGKITRVLGEPSMPGAVWFEGARLNYAENLLRRPSGSQRDRPALIFENEEEVGRRIISRGELGNLVARCAEGLRRLGIRPGDRVAALTPNVPEAVVAMLGAASIGAIWSSCSPDFGPQGVLDRFGQIQPSVLFAADGYFYGGKRHRLGERLRDVIDNIPSIRHTIIYPYAGPEIEGLPGQIGWEEFLGEETSPLLYGRFPFDHPLFILYTSGTTGVPKCILHGAGGTLLKHLEEHVLQVDLRPTDVFFYFTTCGWMMWNWLVSGLATGATVVLYDGSPLHPDPGRLFRLADRCGITIFGTSPRFLGAVEKSGLAPGKKHSLKTLRTILSTGSPLHPSQFEWVYKAVKPDIQIASISGGTDLIGCFVGGSPLHAVHAGEIQCRTLGMKVESVDEEGRPVAGRKGELVCSAPFPSMPVGFWNDADGSKYQAAYFERFPGRWHHGDYIEITARGTAVIHGRSDATLNPGGVRIGTAEIYRIVEKIPEVVDALAVGRETGADVEVLLFVVLREGADLDDDLQKRIRDAIRAEASPRHVPKEIHPIAEVPRTISGKPVELAVARILRGEEVPNRDALANPESLDQFQPFARA